VPALSIAKTLTARRIDNLLQWSYHDSGLTPGHVAFMLSPRRSALMFAKSTSKKECDWLAMVQALLDTNSVLRLEEKHHYLPIRRRQQGDVYLFAMSVQPLLDQPNSLKGCA
jgi:hypothetical protein